MDAKMSDRLEVPVRNFVGSEIYAQPPSGRKWGLLVPWEVEFGHGSSHSGCPLWPAGGQATWGLLGGLVV